MICYTTPWDTIHGDPLVAINAAVPFELFRLKLKTALIKGGLRRSEDGRRSAAMAVAAIGPTPGMVSRIFRLLDPEQFSGCFGRFMARFAAEHGVIAIDGKVSRRSFVPPAQAEANYYAAKENLDMVA